MSTYVLVHGAWHGGWVWDKVAGLLRDQGHAVHAPDLPGHGADRTPIAQVTLKAYVDRVAQKIEECSGPVILAGHSMGGLVISQTAEERPDRIAVLVYVCAFLPQDGQNLVQWAENDHEALVHPNLIFSEDKSSATLPKEYIRQAFYEDCSPEEVDRVLPRLVPQATAPFISPVNLTLSKFGRVPRIYVECLRDRAISISVQRRMLTQAGCNRVFTLDCDHSPMLSRPQELAECLLAAQATGSAARSA
jgi:pimeloyl-ACP methyl ester carboxylesterase